LLTRILGFQLCEPDCPAFGVVVTHRAQRSVGSRLRGFSLSDGIPLLNFKMRFLCCLKLNEIRTLRFEVVMRDL
jgi:hypothetical protein